MKQEVMLSNRQAYPPKDGMLFVRTSGILSTMVQVPTLALGLIVVAIIIPAQISFGSTKSLDLTIYQDGSTHVFSEISANPFDPEYTVELFGTEIDNFVAEDENGFLLSGNIEGNIAVVETLGASSLTINYDTHDLISKQGRIWSFNIDSSIDYSLLMPKNTVVVGMSNYPLSMQVIDEHSQLFLPSGPLELNYFFGINDPLPVENPPSKSGLESSIWYIFGGIIAAGLIAGFIIKRSKRDITKRRIDAKQFEVIEKPLDAQTIFEHKPDLRDDDKELINFISSNGGQAFESELRKKFLQPRTTMWRAVKRLERHGIIEIEKRELQNLVKLKKNLEDEQ